MWGVHRWGEERNRGEGRGGEEEQREETKRRRKEARQGNWQTVTMQQQSSLGFTVYIKEIKYNKGKGKTVMKLACYLWHIHGAPARMYWEVWRTQSNYLRESRQILNLEIERKYLFYIGFAYKQIWNFFIIVINLLAEDRTSMWASILLNIVISFLREWSRALL